MQAHTPHPYDDAPRTTHTLSCGETTLRIVLLRDTHSLVWLSVCDGFLPDGSDERAFPTRGMALAFAQRLVDQLAAEDA